MNSTYGQFGTWNTIQPPNFGYSDDPSEPVPQRVSGAIGRVNAVSRARGGMAGSSSSSAFYWNGLPKGPSFLWNGLPRPGTLPPTGTGTPDSVWMRNSQGGSQTPGDYFHFPQSEGPVDEQLSTKDPTGRPWPSVNPELTKRDYDLYGAGSHFGFSSRGGSW